MFKTLIASGLVIALTVTQTQAVSAQELTVGSKAPKLEVKKFIKGDEVKSFEKGKIYVVELWATWCGPCRTTIPHLTDLQKKHKDVTIIGVAIMEEDPSIAASIADTLAKAYFDNGELANAVKTQERVIELAAGTQMEADPGLKKRLRQYKKALDASKEKDNVDNVPVKPKK